MYIEKDYVEYLSFVERYYPESSMVAANENKVFKNVIYDILKSIHLLDTYYYCDDIPDGTETLIKDLKMYLIRLLYILPINDFFFIDTLLRSTAESLLRIVYQIINPEINLETVKNTNYRKLWAEGIKITSIFQSHKDRLSNINRIFSDKSLTIHSSQKKYNNQIDYLVYLMEDKTQISIKQLNSDIRSIYIFTLEDLFNLLEIKEENLTMQQSVTLKTLTLKDPLLSK